MKLRRMALALFLFLLLISCITSSTYGNVSSEITDLHVTRVSLFPGNGFAPFQTTVNDAAKIQPLYDAALALPPIPPDGIKHLCLNDGGLIYHLDFQPTTVPSSQMVLDPAGCELLVIGKSDVRQMNQTFLTLLAKAINVSWLYAPYL
ncbi:MAG: hypothetical protein ACYDER_28825 [Ktedonobacteraceae bacterium]